MMIISNIGHNMICTGYYLTEKVEYCVHTVLNPGQFSKCLDQNTAFLFLVYIGTVLFGGVSVFR